MSLFQGAECRYFGYTELIAELNRIVIRGFQSRGTHVCCHK